MPLMGFFYFFHFFAHAGGCDGLDLVLESFVPLRVPGLDYSTVQCTPRCSLFVGVGASCCTVEDDLGANPCTKNYIAKMVAVNGFIL